MLYQKVKKTLFFHYQTKLFLGFMLTDEVCESKWISFMSKKNSLKIIDPQGKLFPKKIKTLIKFEDFPNEDKILEEDESFFNTKRNSVFKRISDKRKTNTMDEEFEKFKEINLKFEKKENNFPIYPMEKSISVYENLKSDIIREKHKDVLDMMELPMRKQTIGPDTQLTLNKFISYDNFITENESKLKANLLNSNPFVFNTKRKRCTY